MSLDATPSANAADVFRIQTQLYEAQQQLAAARGQNPDPQNRSAGRLPRCDRAVQPSSPRLWHRPIQLHRDEAQPGSETAAGYRPDEDLVAGKTRGPSGHHRFLQRAGHAPPVDAGPTRREFSETLAERASPRGQGLELTG